MVAVLIELACVNVGERKSLLSYDEGGLLLYFGNPNSN